PGVRAAASLRGTSLGYRIHKSSTLPPLQISIDSPGNKIKEVIDIPWSHVCLFSGCYCCMRLVMSF
ncbi:hypothetical protein KSS87_012309, partial [Heliosperma pusillum]